MFLHRFATSLSALIVLAAVATTTISHIHGRVTAIDAKRGTFMIHHDPYDMMPMAMTMEVQPVHRTDLKKLHVGEIIYVTIDTAIVPWPGTQIRPDPRAVKH